jgi:DNA-directed RNA polymerase specialized sigma24 family protein
VREAIALAQDLPDEAQFDMCWVFATGDPDINRQASELRDRRQEVTRASRELATETAALVKRLRELGFSVRDAATITGISRARAGQLTAIAGTPGSRQTRNTRWSGPIGCGAGKPHFD